MSHTYSLLWAITGNHGIDYNKFLCLLLVYVISKNSGPPSRIITADAFSPADISGGNGIAGDALSVCNYVYIRIKNQRAGQPVLSLEKFGLLPRIPLSCRHTPEQRAIVRDNRPSATCISLPQKTGQLLLHFRKVCFIVASVFSPVAITE